MELMRYASAWRWGGVFLILSALAACGGGGSGSTTTPIAASDVMGTWKLISVNSVDVSAYNVSMVADASTYTFVVPISVPNWQTTCTEYGTWSLSGSNLVTTPLAGSTCGSSAGNAPVTISGSTMTIASAGGTQVYQKQPANTVTTNALQGTWTMMADDNAGTVTSQLNVTGTFNSSSYSYSNPNCSESGTWTVNNGAVTLSPSSGTCGNTGSRTLSASMNYPLLTLSPTTTHAEIWQFQAGLVNTAPSNPVAAGGSGVINISWQLVGGATSYNIYRGTSSGTLTSNAFIGAVTSSAYTDASVTPGTTYYYQITAVGANGESAPSTEVSGVATAATTSSLPSPVAGLAVIPGNTEVALSWNAVSGATSYNLYYVHTPAGTTVPYWSKNISTNPPSYPLTSWSSLGSTQYTTQYIGGLTNGDTYQFMVTAVNSNGESLSTSYVQTVPAVPVAATWTQQSSGTTVSLRGIAYNGSQYLAVGGGVTPGSVSSTDTAEILTSPDGVTWTPTPNSGTGKALMRVIWCGPLGQYVAVGFGGTILTSPDGQAWTSRSSGTANALWGITWSTGLGRLVTVGDAGTILTSPDGVAWTAQSSGTTQNLRRVIRLGGQFVTLGWGGTILTSADGLRWSLQTSGTAYDLFGISTNGNTYVAVGGNGTILTSSDAITWAPVTSGVSAVLDSIMWDGSKFVAVGQSGTVLTSLEGIVWNNVTPTPSTTATLRNVIEAHGQYVSVGDSGTIMTSP